MDENTETIKTSIFPDDSIEHIEKEYAMLNTWLLLGVLVVLFFLLKKFIYIPDEKRHGK